MVLTSFYITSQRELAALSGEVEVEVEDKVKAKVKIKVKSKELSAAVSPEPSEDLENILPTGPLSEHMEIDQENFNDEDMEDPELLVRGVSSFTFPLSSQNSKV